MPGHHHHHHHDHHHHHQQQQQQKAYLTHRVAEERHYQIQPPHSQYFSSERICSGFLLGMPRTKFLFWTEYKVSPRPSSDHLMFPIPSSPGHLDQGFLPRQATGAGLRVQGIGRKGCFYFPNLFEFKYIICTQEYTNFKLIAQ